MDVSNSEIQNFLRCRRMWELSSSNRMNLAPAVPWSATALHVGALVHRVLEEQIKCGCRPDIDLIITDEEAELEEMYKEIVGVGFSEPELESLAESRAQVKGLTTHYFDFYGEEHPLGEDMRYLVAEITFRTRIPGTQNWFRGTIDGIAQDTSGAIWVVDHKTYSDRPARLDYLQVDPQFTSYAWAAQQLLGHPVEGVIYDGIAKRVPEKPRQLKDGSLSKAKQGLYTTAGTYMDTIIELDLDPDDYTDILKWLYDRDQSEDNGFFVRYKIRYSQASLEQQVRDIVVISREMASKNLVIYPQFAWSGCWDCDYRDLCSAMQHREDLDFLIKQKYQANRGWKTTRAENPVEDLRHLTANWGESIVDLP
jgi:RecB family exonuclease